MAEQGQKVPSRSRHWIRQHLFQLGLFSILAALVGVLFWAPFSGAIAGPLLQVQPTPTPGPAGADTAVIGLIEQEGSGFHGMAMLRADDGQTEVVVGLIPPSPGFIELGPTEEDIGRVAIYTGTCEQIGNQVQDLGQLRELYRFNGDERVVYALRMTIDMSMDQLLSGDNVLVVLQREQEAEPGQPTPTPEGPGQQEELVCGVLRPEATLAPSL